MNHPEIIRAEVLGCCMGVRRALSLAFRAADTYPRGKLSTLGPLIHNKDALSALKNKGVGSITAEQAALGSAPDEVLIIRAHGIPPSLRSELQNQGRKLIDATCPRVLANQKRSADFGQRGYMVIIAGERDHGEVAAVAGCAQGAVILGSRAEAEQFIAEKGSSLPPKTVLISQTTISRREYDEIAAVLKTACPSLETPDTICPATEERQEALRSLAGKVDGVLVIGGRHSANTQRLFMIANELFREAALIENASEIPKLFFNLPRVGLTAGASTPDNVIDEVEAALRQPRD